MADYSKKIALNWRSPLLFSATRKNPLPTLSFKNLPNAFAPVFDSDNDKSFSREVGKLCRPRG